MRIVGLLLLTFSCVSTAGAQSAPPDSKPAQAPERQSPAQAPPGAEAPGTSKQPHLAPGAAIYLLIIEPAGKTELNEVPFRTGTVGMYEKLAREFKKQNRFRMVERSAESEAVFFLFRYWKANYPHNENYFALALPPDELKKHIEWLNGYRGVAHVEDMLPAAFWGTGRNYNMAEHWTVGLATAGLLNLGRPNPVDLVKQFHHDMQ